MIRYYLFHNRMQASSAREWISMITPVLKTYKAITKAIRTKQSEKESLQSQKKKLSFLQPVQYYQISQKITTLTEDIEELLSQKERLICNNYFHNESEIKTSEITLKNSMQELMKEILSGIRFIRSYTPRWDRDSMPPCFMNLSVI
ncbi:hypothetical protein HNP82_002793 [Catenibacillus scindens]|uniref:Uncharacterized protein n=1 Tax=Catenibacillus scindens TaxID=673271 RepID=A0A7W8M6R3_9FIRM|nr:hypothetical protein [Catenibacillus scindens]MBB5265646.1 hypothetical protein [Catenibacillus scindens]